MENKLFKISRKKSTSLLLLSIILSQLVIMIDFNNTGISLNKKYTQNNNIDNNIKPNPSQSLWYILPTFSSKYFSPDAYPGEGDAVLYYFATEIDEKYSLNISAYYDPIDNFPYSFLGSGILSAAYLMPNGTWLIVAAQYNVTTFEKVLIFGKGTNTTNFKWKKIGNFNNTQYIAIAGDNSGKIKVVYIEESGLNRKFKGIISYYSNDWGKTWSQEEICNYTNFYNITSFYGISIAEFGGTFTCAWSASVIAFGSPIDNATIIATQDSGSGWSSAQNVSAITEPGSRFPQVIYNQTANNGTLFIAYDCYDDFLMGTQKSKIIELKDGLFNPATREWEYKTSITFAQNNPMAYWAKDYKTNLFYILDNTLNKNSRGIRNATWNQNITERSVDVFCTESDIYFNIYANDGPKCFSGAVLNPNKDRVLGILDCKTPFHVRKYNGTAKAYNTISYIFDGKDFSGKSRKAMAYSFNLQVGTGGSGNIISIVYVDNRPIKVNYTMSSSKISPFTSPGQNDKFTVDIQADKAAEFDFHVMSEKPVNKSTYISRDLGKLRYFKLAGDGLTLFAFFTDEDAPVLKLSYIKSSDGGITWSDPVIIDTSLSNNYYVKNAIVKGEQIYLWISDSKKGLSNSTLYTSLDGGQSFIDHPLYHPILAVTEDLSCWNGYDNFGHFIINKSTDLGYTWDLFVNLTLQGALNYSLESAAYDPITGNYSFLLSHQYKKEILFVQTNNNGDKYTISNNIITQSYYWGSNLKDSTFVNVLKNSTTSKWIIFSSAINQVNINTFQCPLAYCTSENGLTFTSWKNYTEITGSLIDIYPIYKSWDVLIPGDQGLPCLITGIIGPSKMPESINITVKSNLVYKKSDNLDNDYHASLSFSGLSSDGEILQDGNYTWILFVKDEAGYKEEKRGYVFIDNTAPVLMPYKSLTDPETPYPVNTTTITVPVKEINYDTGVLYYRIPGGNWQKVIMTVDDTNLPYVNFTGVIPSQASSVATVYWKVIINDTCGNELVLDNNGQLYSYSRGVYEYVKAEGLLAPTLYDNWNWSYIFTSGVDHIEKVWVRMEFNDNTQKDVYINGSGSSNSTFTILILHDTIHTSAVYKFMFKTDINQVFTIEEIALKRPEIRIEEQEEPPSVLDLAESDEFTITIVAPEYEDYIKAVYIEYEFDDGSGKHLDTMNKTGSIYTYTFSEFPEDATSLNYTIYAIDIYGNKIELGKTREISILPELPSFDLTIQEQILVSFIALIVGVCSGLAYSIITGRKEHRKALLRKLSRKLKLTKIREKESALTLKEKGKEIVSGDESSISGEPSEVERRLNLIISLSALGFAATAAIAFISLYILQNAVLAIWLFIIAFLLTVVLWIYMSANSVEKIFRSEEIQKVGKDKFILSALSILIYIMLLYIFITGNSFAWWRVRVAQQSYNIGGIIVPRALTTVTTTFFSSIFLLTWSTFKEVGNRADELKKAEELNENPLYIMQRREQAISKVIGNVGKKGILFITIIGVVIIFASDLNVYANQAIMIVIPFAIGAILTLMIGAYIGKKQKEEFETEAIIMDHLIICPHCKNETALGGNYCEVCGQKLLTRDRITEGIVCPKCHNISPLKSNHCRYCGTKLKED
ncbi:MAG: double zinc ribbon domain-containing protein [Promethearchaeota archaeon]